MSARAPRRHQNTFTEPLVFDTQAGGVVAELLNKGGVQERLHHAGLDLVDTQIGLDDYAAYLSGHGHPAEQLKAELAAQLLAKMRTAEVMNQMRIKDTSIPF